MILALVAGYLAGGAPTADWVAAVRGIDLRASGSGNPGANNARRVGGPALGIVVLTVEVAKGIAIVAAARAVDPAFEVPVAIAGVAGNVFNPFRRFAGGQGLGISLGLLIAAWPTIVPGVLLVIAAVAAGLRRTPAAAISAFVFLIGSAVAWRSMDLPMAWGVDNDQVIVLAIGITVVMLPKQVGNLMRDRRDRTVRPGRRRRSPG
jgi:glycerol-3-phosphate acyltransferase PlsY